MQNKFEPNIRAKRLEYDDARNLVQELMFMNSEMKASHPVGTKLLTSFVAGKLLPIMVLVGSLKQRQKQ